MLLLCLGDAAAAVAGHGARSILHAHPRLTRAAPARCSHSLASQSAVQVVWQVSPVQQAAGQEQGTVGACTATAAAAGEHTHSRQQRTSARDTPASLGRRLVAWRFLSSASCTAQGCPAAAPTLVLLVMQAQAWLLLLAPWAARAVSLLTTSGRCRCARRSEQPIAAAAAHHTTCPGSVRHQRHPASRGWSCCHRRRASPPAASTNREDGGECWACAAPWAPPASQGQREAPGTTHTFLAAAFLAAGAFFAPLPNSA